MQRTVDLPAIQQSGVAQQMFWAASLVVAFAGLTVVAVRIASHSDLVHWWTPLAFAAGMLIADFGSGLVHWGADTWGRDDLPVIGPRLLVPFRVHHVNPDDFLRRSFVDTNGDVALVTLPVLTVLVLWPAGTPARAAALVFGFALCGVGMMTNQIHQWAHMPSPPRIVRVLQRCGLILSRGAHATHHGRPYDAHYCITTGWCNRPLEAIGFFRTLESVITRVTGAQPRQDDHQYEQRYGIGTPSLARHD